MDGSVRLSGSERKTALLIYRGGRDSRVARRAHGLLLLVRNWSYRQIMESTLCASDCVAAAKLSLSEDEVDLHLNPKIGCFWAAVGQQATVETPRNNVTLRLAESLVLADRYAVGQ